MESADFCSLAVFCKAVSRTSFFLRKSVRKNRYYAFILKPLQPAFGAFWAELWAFFHKIPFLRRLSTALFS